MPKGLFKNLPIIEYDGKLARNLMVSSKIVKDAFANPIAFFQYTVEDGETPEEIAYTFYDSVFYSWLVLFSNDIVDVYNEWPKSYKQMTEYYIQKYGSVPAAKEQILHYKNPKYGFTINQATYSRYANSDFVDATISVERTGWEPVTAFEHEEERNDNLRNIKLIDPSFTDQIKREMELLFNG